MPKVPVKTHIQRILEKNGWTKTSTVPLEYNKADITLTLTRWAITAARTSTWTLDPDVRYVLGWLDRHHIPIRIWRGP
jgi:hypothetical protein